MLLSNGDGTFQAPREFPVGPFHAGILAPLIPTYRRDLVLVVAELTTLADLGLIDQLLAWRDRLGKLVFGRRPTLEQSTRAVIAFGGLQDCCLQFPDTPYEKLRRATVDGALAALGIDQPASG